MRRGCVALRLRGMGKGKGGEGLLVYGAEIQGRRYFSLPSPSTESPTTAETGTDADVIDGRDDDHR
jgi:hypothetical protein